MLLTFLASSALALSQPSVPRSSGASASRRSVLSSAAAGATALAFAQAASADNYGDIIEGSKEFSRMGGLLEPFIDTTHGFKMYKPSGWNKFDADPGVFGE